MNVKSTKIGMSNLRFDVETRDYRDLEEIETKVTKSLLKTLERTPGRYVLEFVSSSMRELPGGGWGYSIEYRVTRSAMPERALWYASVREAIKEAGFELPLDFEDRAERLFGLGIPSADAGAMIAQECE